MLPWLTGDRAGDPGRVHTEGRMARSPVSHGSMASATSGRAGEVEAWSR